MILRGACDQWGASNQVERHLDIVNEVKGQQGAYLDGMNCVYID